LSKGSTPLDFAYAIHTEIGHRCRGAKVNGRIVPLTYILQSGEQVEILTAKEGEPNHHWIDSNLGYLKSRRTINKVKRWFKQQDDEKNIRAGKAFLEKEILHADVAGVNLIDIVAYFKKTGPDQLYLAIGRREINSHQLAGIIVNKHEVKRTKRSKRKFSKAAILIDGMSNVASSLAHCCYPEVGDDIVGFISHFKGITIHQSMCENITHLSRKQQTQLIAARWETGEG